MRQTPSPSRCPAFLLVCQRREGFDDCLGDADDYFPVGEIVRRGFAAAVFRTWDVAPDFNTGNTQGVFTAFERPGPYRDNRLWGTLSAWAWGASRALDLIETMPDVDASKVAVVGHSRGGKAALWAAVTDTRFAMACVNGSGCAGAKLNHIDLPKSEHIAQIARTFPYWFCSDYILWANREKEMPFDQHELLSCIAPRLLAVGSGSKDVWAGPDGERMATELARAAWADASRVSYHCHDGGHDLGLVDWDAYLSHAERFWKRRWPFIAIRHTSAVNAMPEVFAQLMESHFRNPGACDEFWFCCGGRKTPDAALVEAGGIAAFRPLCEKAGIRLSFQQGVTLGHGGTKPLPGDQGFTDDSFQVDADGRRLAFLCPRAPAVLAYECEYVKAVLQGCSPDSYWLDDDLRLGVHKTDGCFCDRCIAAFNAKTGGAETRQSLAAKLYSKAVREPVRAAWIAFNAESLAIYAAAARAAADNMSSPCRLAYQAVWSDTIYTGYDTKPILEALSGPLRRPVGIRPGAMFYVEAKPREMVRKCLSVAREAERCRSWWPLVASVCYDQETYPRHVLHKSPGAIMTECALALASGCDSLSLYWYAGEAPEPVAEYDRFVRILSAARPYFERLAASTRRTRLGGVARFVGSAAAETSDFDLRDETDFDLACAGIPVTVAESGTKLWYLTEKSRREMTDADDALLASGTAVDIEGIGKYPLADRRAKLLDDLDAATNGLFPVRVDACRALRILPRVRDDGRLDSVTLLNLSIGETGEIEVRVRRPVSHKAFMQTVKMALPVVVPCVETSSSDECVVTIRDMQGWQIATLFFER